jgi:hypothetical protein
MIRGLVASKAEVIAISTTVWIRSMMDQYARLVFLSLSVPPSFLFYGVAFLTVVLPL